MLILAGCSSPARRPVPYEDSVVRSELYRQYEKWRGVPYRLGGTSKNGVDCSALVQITYKDVYGIDLPRNTWELSQIGTLVEPDRLQSGDLVFFKIALWGNHVGIYIAGGKFMHASASKGVIVSDLSNPYWRDHYWKSLRPLPPTTASR